jgi:hypothetical protein
VPGSTKVSILLDSDSSDVEISYTHEYTQAELKVQQPHRSPLKPLFSAKQKVPA